MRSYLTKGESQEGERRVGGKRGKHSRLRQMLGCQEGRRVGEPQEFQKAGEQCERMNRKKTTKGINHWGSYSLCLSFEFYLKIHWNIYELLSDMVIFLIQKDLHGSRAENGYAKGEPGGRGPTWEAVIGIQVRSDEKLNWAKGVEIEERGGV